MTTTETEIQTQDETQLFEAAAYDLPGTPALNGRKARTVVLSFDPYELDRTDADHMELAGRLEPDEEIRLTVIAKVSKRAWAENPAEVKVIYRLEIEELG